MYYARHCSYAAISKANDATIEAAKRTTLFPTVDSTKQTAFCSAISTTDNATIETANDATIKAAFAPTFDAT